MANIIKIKNKTTSGVPTALQMATKELVFNEVDNKLYYKKESDDSVIHINQNSGGTVTSIGISIGVSGSDINISGSPITTSGSITVNIPTASATNRGALSSSDWTTFNNKVGGSGAANKVTYWTSATNISYNNNFHWDNTNGRLGIGTASPTYQLTTTQDVLLNGIRAGKGNGSLSENTVFGANSGSSLTGNYNSFFGYNAGQNITTGQSNVGIGPGALQSGNGSWNIGIGYNALKVNTANNNVGIGVSALVNNTTGTKNVGIGSNSLASNIEGEQNIAIGTNALYNANSSYNVGIGVSAGYNITSGYQNMLIGTFAGLGLTTQNGNTAIGVSSMRYASGQFNLGIGNATLQNVSGSYNIAVGGLNALTTGANNVGIGVTVLNNMTTGSYNVAIGRNAGLDSNGSYNVFIGNDVGRQETGDSKLMIWNKSTLNEANDRDRAIIYGEMGSVPANQNLHLNAKVKVSEKPSAATTIAGYDASGYFANVTLGSGLSLSGGTLSASGGSGTVTSVAAATGTSGTDFNITGSPITTSGTLTFNIPTASASNRGALSSDDWTTFNSKISGTGSTGRVPFFDSSSSISSNSNFTYQGGTGTLTAPYIKATSSGGTATTVTGRDSNNIISNITIGSQLALSSGTLNTTGFSGTFKTGDAKIVTVVNGIITSVI